VPGANACWSTRICAYHGVRGTQAFNSEEGQSNCGDRCGRPIGLGTHDQLLVSNPLYARLAELQFGVGKN